MIKGPVFDFLGLYQSILKDWLAIAPNDNRECERDIKSLSALLQSRGLGFVTIDLPKLDVALRRGLADGRLNVIGLVGSRRRSNTDLRPRLLWGFWSRVFDEDCCLLADPDINAITFLRTLLSVFKKLRVECAPTYTFDVIRSFVSVDASLPVPSEFWDRSDFSYIPSDSFHDCSVGDYVSAEDLFPSGIRDVGCVLDSVQRSADRIAGFLGVFDPNESRFRHGPGAVSDLRTGEFKYDFPGWSDSLDSRFPWLDFGTTKIGLSDRLSRDGISMVRQEPSSRLITVPKTRTGPRLIASEPTANQWVQQCIRDFMYRRTSATSIGTSVDFRRQDLSRGLALEASKRGDYATLDLSDASDRVSCHLVERIFRRNAGFLASIAACRTRYTINDIDAESPRLIKLRKFSTMGNALTFPIQSLVFLAICLGVGSYLHPRKSWKSLSREVRIFGDDIIVPNNWSALVKDVLSVLKLKVNQTKSYETGLFRESCGMDAYGGYDVTPGRVVLSDHEPAATLLVSRTATSNNFHKKGYWYAAEFLAKTVGHIGKPSVVNSSSGLFGLTTFVNRGLPRLKTRWDPNLQRFNVSMLSVSTKTKRLRQDSPGALLQFFTEEPDPLIKWESGCDSGQASVVRRRWVPLEELGFKPSYS